PKVVRAAIAKLPVTIVDEREEQNMLVLVVQAKSGARATIALGKDGGGIATTMRPTTSKPPGACVAIPQVSHRVYVRSGGVNDSGEFHESTRSWELDTTRMLDVDGDGISDVFVPVAPNADACPGAVSWRVFVIRGTCGHDVGVVGPGDRSDDAHTVPLAPS